MPQLMYHFCHNTVPISSHLCFPKFTVCSNVKYHKGVHHNPYFYDFGTICYYWLINVIIDTAPGSNWKYLRLRLVWGGFVELAGLNEAPSVEWHRH